MSSARPAFGDYQLEIYLAGLQRSILAEADLIMAVDGYPTLADLTPDGLRRTCPHHP